MYDDCVAGYGLPRVSNLTDLDPNMLTYNCPCVVASKWDFQPLLGCDILGQFYFRMANNEVGEGHRSLAVYRERGAANPANLFPAVSFKQGSFRTVAQAMQDAMLSLLKDEDEGENDEREIMQFRSTVYAWGAFLPNGYANVKLENCFLEEMYNRILLAHST